MSYAGDFDTSDVVYLKFTTVNTSGVPTQLAGTPAVSIYKDGSTTQTTTGVTLTVDFDTVTGLNHVAIDTSADGTFYAAGSDFIAIITTGTVSGSSVVGYEIGSFSIRNRAALLPTTAGRTLDVSAGGEAGVDWANVGSPTTTVGLSGTTVKTATDVETDTADIQTRIPAALTAGGNIKADALALSGDTTAADNAEAFFDGTGYAGNNNVIPTVTTLTNLPAITTGWLTAAGIAADAITDAKVASDVTIASVTGSVGSVTAAITLPTIPTNWITADGIAADAIGSSELATSAVSEIVTAVLTTQMTEAYAADGVAPTPTQALMLILQHLSESSISSTTKTVKKLDGSTSAATFTLDSATTPTLITRAT